MIVAMPSSVPYGIQMQLTAAMTYMKILCFLFLMQWPAYAVNAPSVHPAIMITPMMAAKIRNIIAGGPWFVPADGDALGNAVGEACCATAGGGVPAFHCDCGINENPRKRKKWISRNETKAAPIAPEM